MSFSITKLLSGFAFWKGEVVGKIIYIAIIVTICLGVYHKITQTTISTENKNILTKPETVNIDQRQTFPEKEDSFFLGVKLFGLKIGVAKEGKRNVETSMDISSSGERDIVQARGNGGRQSKEDGTPRVDGKYKDEGSGVQRRPGYLSRLWSRVKSLF